MKNFCVTFLIGLISMSSVYAVKNETKTAEKGTKTTVKNETKTATENGVHLFILSGQSNMSRFQEQTHFTPAMEAKFGKDNVAVVKQAKGSLHIRLWDKDWKHPTGSKIKGSDGMYRNMMKKAAVATEGKTIKTVTFIWMQGEADAAKSWGTAYEASLRRIMKRIEVDLKRTDINFIIGRLSDYAMDNKWPHWTMIRDIQVSIGESSPRGAWIDTDDLNGADDNLHYNKNGYKELGKRYAEKAIELINKNAKKEIEKK